jgi:hypothetical protein
MKSESRDRFFGELEKDLWKDLEKVTEERDLFRRASWMLAVLLIGFILADLFA